MVGVVTVCRPRVHVFFARQVKFLVVFCVVCFVGSRVMCVVSCFLRLLRRLRLLGPRLLLHAAGATSLAWTVGATTVRCSKFAALLVDPSEHKFKTQST